MIRNISGGVTAAMGFSAACCAAGIKYQDRTDMAMLYSTVPCNAAGTFTTNRVKAAPVLWDRDIVSSGCPAQAVVVNAGIANAATGKTGLDLCRKTAEAAGKILDIPAGGDFAKHADRKARIFNRVVRRLDPFRRAHDLRDAHLVDLAAEREIVWSLVEPTKHKIARAVGHHCIAI